MKSPRNRTRSTGRARRRTKTDRLIRFQSNEAVPEYPVPPRFVCRTVGRPHVPGWVDLRPPRFPFCRFSGAASLRPPRPKAFPLRHNSPVGCCGFHCRCRCFAAATGILRLRWHRASHGSPMTDEVVFRIALCSFEAAARRRSPSSASLRSAPSPQGEGFFRGSHWRCRRRPTLIGYPPGPGTGRRDEAHTPSCRPPAGISGRGIR